MADEKPKYTPEGLPVLSEDVSAAFLRDLKMGPEHMTDDIIKNIAITNERIASYMASAVLSYPEAYQNRILGHLCCLYELLRRQADANKMGELYK